MRHEDRVLLAMMVGFNKIDFDALVPWHRGRVEVSGIVEGQQETVRSLVAMLISRGDIDHARRWAASRQGPERDYARQAVETLSGEMFSVEAMGILSVIRNALDSKA